jgi:hypothetical protein
MAITAPVSLTKIKTEFDGPNNLAAYVRGGTYVPNISANSAINTSPTGLAISQFLGATNLAVSLPTNWGPFDTYEMSVSANYISFSGEGLTITAKAVLTIKTNGTMSGEDFYGEAGCAGSLILDEPSLGHTWLQAGDASAVYVRLDIDYFNSELPAGSATGTNLQLNTERSWNFCSAAPFGDNISKFAYGTLSLRDAANNVLASKTIWLGASATNSD